MLNAASSSKVLRVLATAAGSLPVALLIRDSCFTFARVKGSSMEPTLKDGEIVFVLKRNYFGFSTGDDIVRRYEWLEFGDSPSALVVGPGDVVLFQNPITLRTDTLIKRVVGVSGQWISHPGVHPVFRFEEMRSYSVFVEGDHKDDDAIDSRLLGPISRNLVLGIAEFVVWPPTRWRTIEAKEAVDNQGRPRAVWSLDDAS